MASDASQSPGLIGFLAWVEVNKRRLLIGGGVALVVLFVSIVTIQRQAQKESDASAALSDLRVPYSAAAVVAPGTADALFKFAQDYRGTKAAARALLMGAGVVFSEQTPSAYAEAQKRFAQLLQDYPTSPWAAEANLGIAKALAAQGKSNEAIIKYEEIGTRLGKSAIADEAKLDLARLYEAQKPVEALRLYEDLSRNLMGSALGAEAAMRQDDLLKAHPELAKLREPPPPSPNLLQNMALTNMIRSMSTNPAAARGSNAARVPLTNRVGSTSQPVQLKLPAGPPATSATNPPPAK